MTYQSAMKHRSVLQLRSLSIAVGAAVLALACGADDSNNNEEPRPVDVPREDPCLNPLNAECPTNQLAPKKDDSVSPGGGPAAASDPKKAAPSQAELDKDAAQNVLKSKCGYCHGTALTKEQAKAGMNFIDDIDKLVAAGKIIPMNSAGSKVIQRMVRKEMPPPGSGYDLVSDAEIQIVAAYIDNPRYWGGIPDSNCEDEGQAIGFDKLYEDINLDLSGEDKDDRVFYRYVSLTNRFTAGVCAPALDGDRNAMVKMMNMLSIKAKVGKLLPANQTQTLYRIDLRDFDWDRAIQVNNQPFNDVWEAIIDANPYAVPFVGDDADDARADTGTDVPVMFADQMMNVATIGNLYYAIIDVDINQTLGTFISDKLGVNVQEDIENEDAIRAGTTRSTVTRQDRLVERHDLVARNGALWQSFDFEADDANQSIFQDPFGFTAGGSEAIFTLPNGMLAYIIADANDRIVEDSDILLDTSQDNHRAITSVSCSNCHAAGFIPVKDEVEPIARANARQIGLDSDEVEQLERIYLKPEAFAQQVKSDTENFYQRALQQANLPLQGGDPVGRVFVRFEDDVRLQDAAGDLGLTPDELADSIGLLDPVLAVLKPSKAAPGVGQIDRDDFTAQFIGALCFLSSSSDNTPDPAICDALVDN
jgi:mono/diheme cytochrome c family protein